jgi:zinc D-Ala-D-Ala carboxypeptidase
MENTKKSKKKITKISDNISYREATHSDTAKKLKIKHDPTEEHLVNMVLIAEKVFQPLREWCEHPIRVNSMYRSEALNTALRGSKSSQHRFGQALDLDTLGEKSNADLFNYISEHLSYDQLIWEAGTDAEPDWIHVSYVNEEKNRKQRLKMKRKGARTQYYNF